MPESPEILIAGSGPAGSATALGLARLGLRVCMVTSARKFAACEGISERTVKGLENAGIRHALRTISDPSPRCAIWNNQHSEANMERLVKREEFDQALLLDLQDAGVELIHGRLTRIDHSADALRLHGETASGAPFYRRADYFVDARGRGPTRGRSSAFHAAVPSTTPANCRPATTADFAAVVAAATAHRQGLGLVRRGRASLWPDIGSPVAQMIQHLRATCPGPGI
jgi:2-polyprenyl-6-methoxyphenol hydroxylase-like FAD-dependent oxidoreductase